MWWYEVRDANNRLLDMRREYFTEQAAQDAAECAKRALQNSTSEDPLKVIILTDE